MNSNGYFGYLISLEGPEGSGKSSHIPNLVDYFRDKGLTVFPTREPGGTSIGEQIREVLHSLKNIEMHPRTETLLYQAARAQIVEQVIIPRLKEGQIIILDRFFDSTIAYQGYGHQQDLGQIMPLIHFATGGLVPDLTVYMDVDVETGIKRKHSSEEWNRMDALDIAFHQRVRRGYLEMAKTGGGRWVVIDAGKGIHEVYSDLRDVIEEKLVFKGFIETENLGPERQM